MKPSASATATAAWQRSKIAVVDTVEHREAPGAPSLGHCQISFAVDMKAAFTSHQQLREYYQAEMAGMRQSFERTGNGVLCIRRRALVVDCLLEPLWRFESGGPLPAGLALVAVGGFGRKELFPCSDVDLLYLCADEQVEDKLREAHPWLQSGHVGSRPAGQPHDPHP